MSDEPLPFIAYEIIEGMRPALARAPYHRQWMDDSANQFAYRCLPLVIANQSGWMLSNAVPFAAVWTGGRGIDAVRVAPDPGYPGYGGWTGEQCIKSHFGEGVLTFIVPYLFRTPPGYNLWVKGPANLFKDGIQALEGVIETDWANATFTMNWKFTRANFPVRFEPGEPICQLVPYPRSLLERLRPELRSFRTDPKTAAEFTHWRVGREQFSADLPVAGTEANRRGWEKDYVQGRQADGSRFEGHQTALKLKDFERVPAPAPRGT